MLIHENYSFREWKPGLCPLYRAPCTVRGLEYQVPRAVILLSLLGEMLHPEIFQGDGSRTSFNLKKYRWAWFSMNTKNQNGNVPINMNKGENPVVSFCLWVAFLKNMLSAPALAVPITGSKFSIALAAYWPNTTLLSIDCGLVTSAGRHSVRLNSLNYPGACAEMKW